MGIKISQTNKELSSVGGLVLFKELTNKILPDTIFTQKHLPSLKSGVRRNVEKFKQLLFGFHAGAECLDDIDKLSLDRGFHAINSSNSYGSKSHGDFLRSFNLLQCKELNVLLLQMAFSLRKLLFPNQQSITFDIDSTQNEQSGKKMEGVQMNYAGIKGLSTIQIFDEYGLQYWHDVRPGNTHTADGALEMIHRLFYNLDTQMKGLTRYVRADSGYCKIGFFHACTAKNAQFVVCMRKLMFKPLLSKISNWASQDQEDPDRVKFVGNRECEIGETTYSPKKSHKTFRVIILRALKTDAVNKLFLTEEDYDYYGWVSSISDEMSSVDVIKFYRKRGHCENFIRETKNGFDLHHYPCQKMIANKAYGLAASFAYNIMRFIALKDNPTHPKFAKAIRFKFVHIPCQIVRHARDLSFRFMGSHYKGVINWLMEIRKMSVGFHTKAT